MVSFSEHKSHSAPLFESVNLLNLDDIFKLQIRSLILLINGHTDSYRPCFNEYFKFTSPVGSYSTRQSCDGNLYVVSINTTQYGVRSLKFTGSRLWHSLPTCITKSNSLTISKLP